MLDALIAERDSRRARSAATLIRMAGFPATKTLEDYDFKFATTAPRRQIEQLASLNFVARRENVVFLGPSSDGSFPDRTGGDEEPEVDEAIDPINNFIVAKAEPADEVPF